MELLKNSEHTTLIHMEMQALIEEMSALMKKIKSGTATLGELEAFAATAQQVNERAIILRYKAIEAKVYGEEVNQKPSDVTTEKVMEIPELEMESHHESMPENIIPVETEQASSSFEFDLFASEDDLTIDEFQSEEAQETIEISKNEKMEEDSSNEIEATHDSMIATESTIETVAEKEMQFEEATPSAIPTSSNEQEHPIYKKLNPNDTSLAGRLMSVRIESLSSAFGFNERMQIIQELFNGSNETFNSTIQTLDELNSKNEARSIVSQTAHSNNWDIESDLALEFIQKVERRYV